MPPPGNPCPGGTNRPLCGSFECDGFVARNTQTTGLANLEACEAFCAAGNYAYGGFSSGFLPQFNLCQVSNDAFAAWKILFHLCPPPYLFHSDPPLPPFPFCLWLQCFDQCARFGGQFVRSGERFSVGSDTTCSAISCQPAGDDDDDDSRRTRRKRKLKEAHHLVHENEWSCWLVSCHDVLWYYACKGVINPLMLYINLKRRVDMPWAKFLWYGLSTVYSAKQC